MTMNVLFAFFVRPRNWMDPLDVEVLITGGRHEPEIARQLKTPMIRRHRPAWTTPNAPFMRKG